MENIHTTLGRASTKEKRWEVMERRNKIVYEKISGNTYKVRALSRDHGQLILFPVRFGRFCMETDRAVQNAEISISQNMAISWDVLDSLGVQIFLQSTRYGVSTGRPLRKLRHPVLQIFNPTFHGLHIPTHSSIALLYRLFGFF